MERILVLRGGALGDFIVTLPALHLLRERWPKAQIELIGNVVAAELALANGLLDRAHSQHEKSWAALFGSAPLPPELSRDLAAFDLVVNYWPDPGKELSQHFPLRHAQVFLWADAQPSVSPAAAHYCAPLRELGLDPKTYRYALGTPEDAARWVAVHPGSGGHRKNWPAERWLELIRDLPAPVLLIIGEAERDVWAALTSAPLSRGMTEGRVAGRSVTLAVELPLGELTQQLVRCRLFLGHDSGVSHLAAACGVPCVLFFGPTDPAMWAPVGPQVRVIRRGQEMTSIRAEDVLPEVCAHLNASAE